MPDRYFLLYILAVMILLFFILFGEMVSQKIKADLIVDMAERGYFQKEVDNKILWIKDEK
jgi:hypothetical protein